LGIVTLWKETPLRNRHTAALSASLLAAGLVLAGCSGTPAEESTPSPASTGPAAAAAATAGAANQADVQFAQMMIVHHQGAIDMARLAADRAASPDVRELAATIEKAQRPEIDTMTRWLAAWDAQPLGSAGAMPGMSHGAMSDTGEGGMASDESMAQLENATGAGVDQLVLQLMTVHHQGAVDMANAEIADGQNPDAVALAHTIVVDQTAEIELMGTLLGAQ
jgi:uncharacterized protein (DUF305 family)